MTAPVFLVPAESIAAAGVGSTLRIDGAEGRHAVAAKRVKVGERIALSDGIGTIADCLVTSVGKNDLECTVSSWRTFAPPAPSVTVVQALAKGERGELAVELMTEAGVDDIVPWAAARSVARWDADKAARGREKWAAAAREASKQARRPWATRIHGLADTPAVARLVGDAQLAVILHEEATQPIAELELPSHGSVVIVVGPEGGLSEDELAAFGALPVRLGPEVVRTSTAGALAAGVLLSRSSRWQADRAQA